MATKTEAAPETETVNLPSTIQEALRLAMIDIGAVRKGETNTHAHYNFRGIDAVVNAASPAFRKYGIVVMPQLVSVRYDDVKTINNKLQTACRVVVDYTFTGPAGDSMTCTVAGEAWDGGDKATPQAMSVAFRIALLQALALPTDDPEVDARPPYERTAELPPAMMTAAQVEDLKAAFAERKINDVTEQVRIISQALGRSTNGGDLTEQDAAIVINTVRVVADLENSLGAKPVDDPRSNDAAEQAAAGEPEEKK